MRSVPVLLMLGYALCCPGQQRPERATTGPPEFARPVPAKGGKVARPPACPAKFEDGLETNGIVPIGNVAGVTPPRALVTPEAEFSDKARKKARKQGGRFMTSSTIAVVVDTDGKLRDLCVLESAAFDLDEEAAKAVWRYRFEPATKDGKPVAKRIQIEVKWRLY